VRTVSSLAFAALAAAVLSACSGGTSSVPRGPAGGLSSFAKHLAGSANQPTHVIIIVQENRTVDNLFQQLPGIDTQNYGLNSHGQQVPLTETGLGVAYDPSHRHQAFVKEYYNGKFNGFDKEICGKGCPADFAYSYVDPADVTQYYQMAEQYAFAEHNLQPNEGPSWPGHMYLIAAQSGQPGSTWYVSENASDTSAHKPTNCEAPAGTTINQINMATAYPGTEGNPIFPCLTGTPTIIDEIASAGLTWRYYTPNTGDLWTAPCDIASFNCPNNPNVVTPQTQILTDIANNALANVSWVIPGKNETDHAGSVKNTGGPAWVSTVVDAVGESPYWADTAIFVVWDDWGGWYDHYAAPNQHPSGNSTDPYEYGFRVPLIAIGAYVKPGYVSATPRDSTSILHFIEDDFGVPSLGKLDQQTDDLSELFDFSQTPNTFVPFDTGGKTIQERRMERPDPSAVVDSE
jgi:phospholipase C